MDSCPALLLGTRSRDGGQEPECINEIWLELHVSEADQIMQNSALVIGAYDDCGEWSRHAPGFVFGRIGAIGNIAVKRSPNR